MPKKQKRLHDRKTTKNICDDISDANSNSMLIPKILDHVAEENGKGVDSNRFPMLTLDETPWLDQGSFVEAPWLDSALVITSLKAARSLPELKVNRPSTFMCAEEQPHSEKLARKHDKLRSAPEFNGRDKQSTKLPYISSSTLHVPKYNVKPNSVFNYMKESSQSHNLMNQTHEYTWVESDDEGLEYECERLDGQMKNSDIEAYEVDDDLKRETHHPNLKTRERVELVAGNWDQLLVADENNRRSVGSTNQKQELRLPKI